MDTPKIVKILLEHNVLISIVDYKIIINPAEINAIIELLSEYKISFSVIDEKIIIDPNEQKNQ